LGKVAVVESQLANSEKGILILKKCKMEEGNLTLSHEVK